VIMAAGSTVERPFF